MHFNLLLYHTPSHLLLKSWGSYYASVCEDIPLLGYFFWGFADSKERELLFLALIDGSDCEIVGEGGSIGDHLISDDGLLVGLGAVVAEEALDLAAGLAEGHSLG